MSFDEISNVIFKIVGFNHESTTLTPDFLGKSCVWCSAGVPRITRIFANWLKIPCEFVKHLHLLPVQVFVAEVLDFLSKNGLLEIPKVGLRIWNPEVRTLIILHALYVSTKGKRMTNLLLEYRRQC